MSCIVFYELQKFRFVLYRTHHDIYVNTQAYNFLADTPLVNKVNVQILGVTKFETSFETRDSRPLS